jgi:hypothetical protein
MAIVAVGSIAVASNPVVVSAQVVASVPAYDAGHPYPAWHAWHPRFWPGYRPYGYFDPYGFVPAYYDAFPYGPWDYPW